MKQIVFGDTHGRVNWKEIVKQDFDRLIFIGDYFDTHEGTTGLEQLNNFNEICEYKRASGKEIVMLIGNHDYHYIRGIDSQCSGYQPNMRPAFEQALEDNKDLLQMCFADEHSNLFSHAGISVPWLEMVGLLEGDLVESVNDLYKYKPLSFAYYMGDHSGYGEHHKQTPIWIRPQSLLMAKGAGIQIVGHTTQKRPILNGDVWFIDTLGTSGEYLVIENGIFSVKS